MTICLIFLCGQVVELQVRLHCKGCERIVCKALCKLKGITLIHNFYAFLLIQTLANNSIIKLCRCANCGNRDEHAQDNNCWVCRSEDGAQDCEKNRKKSRVMAIESLSTWSHHH